jgi:hypothetical protein
MLLDQYQQLAERVFSHTGSRRESCQRLITHALALPTTHGRRTISRMLCTLERQQRDWSADYKLFSRSPWRSEELFDPVIDEWLGRYPSGPIAAALDETKLRRTGKKIPGAQWLRDPLSPAFHTNLLWGERRLHVSLLFPHYQENGGQAVPCRAVPLRFEQTPHVKKPGKTATEQEQQAYRRARKQTNLSTCAVEAIRQIRERINQRGGSPRALVIAGDGSFCNRTVFRAEIAGGIWLSRMSFPAPAGSRRTYGTAFTPEEVRHSEFVPYRSTTIFHGGQWRAVRFKEVPHVLWQRGAGPRRLRLIVVAPTPYKTSPHSRTFYHQAAYLLCTDPDELPVEQLLQIYFDRWQIEVNHREIKDVFGVGDAQVRSKHSVLRHPAFAVACYSLLLIAGMQAFGPAWNPLLFPLPCWRKKIPARPSAFDLLTRLRHEIYETRDSRHDLDKIARNLGRWSYT